ncbi:asparagine synthetase B, partial [Bacillus thuringiensis]|nr:asparagine synthetase B [Bacillus thuringiensis]
NRHTNNAQNYNYQQKRKQLEEKGHKFQTKSDTEELLHAYLEWQEDSDKHLNGIFAYGIWDQRFGKLMIGRDHLGVKPLFFAQ